MFQDHLDHGAWSTLGKDLSVPLSEVRYHDPSALGSVFLIQIIGIKFYRYPFIHLGRGIHCE